VDTLVVALGTNGASAAVKASLTLDAWRTVGARVIFIPVGLVALDLKIGLLQLDATQRDMTTWIFLELPTRFG
jgi:hypothetical protein